jgi:hypothetical protein
LQIINIFGKRKGILNTKLTVGRNPVGGRARPNSHSLFPLTPAQPSAAQPKPACRSRAKQRSPTQPARRPPPLTEPTRPARNRSSTRHSSYPIRNPFKPRFIPFDLSPKSLIGRVRCDHESCRSPYPLRPCAETPINSTTNNSNFAQD